MKKVIILCALVSLTVAAVLPEDAQAQIVKYDNSNDGTGNYRFSYETSNGISREETGHLVNVGTEDEYIVVEGSYSYPDTEGNLVVIKYTADKDGYHIGPDTSFSPEEISTLPASLTASLLGK